MAPPTRYPHVNGPTLVTIAPEPPLRVPLARSTRQSALAGIVHPGDGDVARAIRAMQRKHFDPPELQPRVKRPRGFIMVAVSMVGNLHERRPSEPPRGSGWFMN
jgi:hypothetical protein